MMSERNASDTYLDVRKAILLMKKRWRWYAMALLILIPGTTLLNKLVKPVYLVSGSIYIKDSQGDMGQKVQDFMQSFQLFDQPMKYQNEMLVLKSTPLIAQAATRMQLEVTYLQREGLSYHEIYGQAPFRVVFDSAHVQPVDVEWSIRFTEDGRFRLSASARKVKTYQYLTSKRVQTGVPMKVDVDGFSGDLIENEFAGFRIFLVNPSELPAISGKAFRFRFNDMKKVVDHLAQSIEVEPANAQVSVVDIHMKSSSAELARDFINTLTDIYLQRNLERKNHLATNTLRYIHDQLNQIQDSLSFAEKKLERFRSSREMMDITNKSVRVFDRIQQLEVERLAMERDYKYYQYLEEHFLKSSELSDLVVPSSMGIPDKTLNELIRDLILLVNQRNDLIAKNQQKSPYLRNLEVQIESMKKPILENIQFAVSTLSKNLDDLTKRMGELRTEAGKLPETERQLVGIERQFELNDGIYTYLLQRQAEAQIAKSSNLPEHEVVEPARFIRLVFPDSHIHYSLALFLAFIVPSLLVFGIDYFDDRIGSEEELRQIAALPYAGTVVWHTPAGSSLDVAPPESMLSEAFRTVRTNMAFLAGGQIPRVILVTSSVSGEGKSFVSYQLAAAYARLGKQTLWVGFDLRKGNPLGSGSFLVHQNTLSDYFLKQCDGAQLPQSTPEPNLSLVLPGTIPPNPLELMLSEATRQLLEQWKQQFEVIVIDTPPIGVVSDAYALMGFSDLNLLVVREQMTRRQALNQVLDDLASKSIGHTALLLNASTLSDRKYRYNYVYRASPQSEFK